MDWEIKPSRAHKPDPAYLNREILRNLTIIPSVGLN